MDPLMNIDSSKSDNTKRSNIYAAATTKQISEMTTNAESSQEHNPFADHSQSVTPEILIDPLTRSSTIALQIESVDSNPDADRQSNVSLQSNTNDTMDDSLTSMQTNRSSVSAIPTDLLPRFHLNEQSPYEPDQLHSDLDLRYLLASAHLSDACEGLEPQFRTDRASVRLYCFYRRPFIRHFLLFVLLVHHSLAFWEPITVEDRQRYPPSSTRVQYVMLIELCCLSYYGMLLALRSRFLPPLRFYADRKHLLLLCTLLLTLVDMLLFVAVPARHALRWSVAFRPLYAINLAESRPIRRAIRNIRRTLPDIGSVLFLFACSILLFAAIRTRLFRHVTFTTSDGQKVEGMFDFSYLLYILVTTANNPDVMMPAYRQNPLYALYFVAFLIVNLYLFMNLMLATIYSNYRRHLKSEVQRMQQARCTSLQQCALALRPAKSAVFNDHKAMQTEASAEHSLSRMQFERLMYAYFRHWQTPLSASRDHLQPLVQLLWALLQRDQVLPESQLNALVELLNKRIALRPDTSDTQSETNSTDLPTSTAESSAESLRHLLLSVHRNLQRWVRSMHFRRFFDALILVNALLIAFDVPFLVDLECPLLILFSFELTAKLVTFGLRGFVSKYWNVFDSFVIGSAVLLSIVTECLRQYQFERSHQLPPWLLPALEGQVDTLLVLRVLRLCKLTARVPRLRLAMRTISRLLPHLALYATLLVLALYTYAVIGMQNFSGLINRQVRARNCTLTSGRTLPYCELTFDSFGSSLLLLFDLLVVNQWHVFADTYSSLAGSRLVRLYFVSFHLLCVLIVLNIFTAFVLEAFALEFASALQGEPDEHHLRRRIARMLRTGGSDCGSETAIKADAGEPNLGYEADQLDADHENVQWIRADQLHTLACQASLSTLTTTVSNASSTTITASAGSQANRAQRLQLIVRPKRSIETLLLKMFSN